jgi:hypothetical protein
VIPATDAGDSRRSSPGAVRGIAAPVAAGPASLLSVRQFDQSPQKMGDMKEIAGQFCGKRWTLSFFDVIQTIPSWRAITAPLGLIEQWP